MSRLSGTLQNIAESGWFQGFILLTILAAAVVVGLETSPSLLESHGHLLHLLDRVILGIFVVEIVIKMGQFGQKPWRYFQDPWNIFDFLIVAVCLIPSDNAQFAAILRLARILRALRLVTAVPRLQLLVACLLKSIPSMAYVGILLFLLFYVYAVMGVFLFRDNDPVHFKNLATSLLTLFRIVTLEDWTDVMYIQMFGSDVYAYTNTTDLPVKSQAMPMVGAMYFVTFVLFGTMVVLNLFIGVIINSMEEAQEDREKADLLAARERGEGTTVLHDVQVLEQSVKDLSHQLHLLTIRLAPQAGALAPQNVVNPSEPGSLSASESNPAEPNQPAGNNTKEGVSEDTGSTPSPSDSSP